MDDRGRMDDRRMSYCVRVDDRGSARRRDERDRPPSSGWRDRDGDRDERDRPPPSSWWRTVLVKDGSQTWASLSFVPPGWPHFLVINKGTGQFYLSSVQGSLQSQYLFPELETTCNRKSR